MFNTNSRVGPYVAVSRDIDRSFMGHGTYRFVLYGAYDAYGLIGPEKNGIAVLDEEKKRVLCDEIARADSGYFGPTDEQWATLADLLSVSWDEFRELINGHERSRYKI